jgi:hypothetical protein
MHDVIRGGYAHDCWDRIAEGYSIPNMGENVKVGQRTLDDKDYEGVNSVVDSSKCT